MKGWCKHWFYLRNDINTPLPAFSGNIPTPHHNWGYGVAKKDLCVRSCLSLKWFLLLPLHLASPPRPSPVEPSVKSACDLIDVAPGSPPLTVVNLGAGLLGSSQPNTTSAIELTMDDYHEPTRDWSRSAPEELA
jgi:hypothetical protein